MDWDAKSIFQNILWHPLTKTNVFMLRPSKWREPWWERKPPADGPCNTFDVEPACNHSHFTTQHKSSLPHFIAGKINRRALQRACIETSREEQITVLAELQFYRDFHRLQLAFAAWRPLGSQKAYISLFKWAKVAVLRKISQLKYLQEDRRIIFTQHW